MIFSSELSDIAIHLDNYFILIFIDKLSTLWAVITRLKRIHLGTLGLMLGQNHLFGIFLGTASLRKGPKYLIVFYDHPSFDSGYKFECIKTNQD